MGVPSCLTNLTHPQKPDNSIPIIKASAGANTHLFCALHWVIHQK